MWHNYFKVFVSVLRHGIISTIYFKMKSQLRLKETYIVE